MTGTVQIISLSKADLEDLLDRAATKAVAAFRDDVARLRVPSIMTKAQVAAYLGKSVPAINRLMKKGLPFEKVDNEHPKFYKSAIDRWLQGERI